MTQKRAMMRLQRIMLADALRIRYAILITGDTLLLSATDHPEVFRPVGVLSHGDFHPDRFIGQLRKIILLAEMSQHDSLQLVMQDSTEQLAGIFIGKVSSVPREFSV